MLGFMTDAFQEPNWNIRTAENGEIAFKAVCDCEPDLIVTDFDMPVMNGISFYNKTCEMAPHLASRFLFITGYVSSDKWEFLKKTGAPLLRKPFRVSKLLEAARITLTKDSSS